MAHYRDSVQEDVFELAAKMRQADVKEVLASNGSSPLEALQKGFEASKPQSIIYKGELIGMFGCAHIDDLIGSPWMLGSDKIPKMALRMKDEQARAALMAQKASFEQTAQNWSRAAKDAVSVEVAQAKNDEKNRASRMLNAEMHEERRVGELTMRTAEQLIKEEAEATLHMTKMNLQKEAESYVMKQAERLQSLAKNEVTEAQAGHEKIGPGQGSG